MIPDVVLQRHPETGELVSEKWSDIIDFPWYQISNYGRVKRKSVPRGPSAITKGRKLFWDEKLLSPRLRKEYLAVSISDLNKKSKDWPIHRLIAIYFIPNPDNLPLVNHKDGIKINNFEWNLEWNTVSGNSLHAADIGLTSTGSKHKWSKLTEVDIHNILDMNKSGVSGAQIARHFNVTKGAIYSILDGTNWTQITKIKKH